MRAISAAAQGSCTRSPVKRRRSRLQETPFFQDPLNCVGGASTDAPKAGRQCSLLVEIMRLEKAHSSHLPES
jgi:hypothetical protein